MSESGSRPVLRLKVSPRQDRVPGGGSVEILPEYKERLHRLIHRVQELAVAGAPRTRWFGEHALLHVAMDEGCLAPSWTPGRLFCDVTGTRLIAPWDKGYLVEIGPQSHRLLLDALRRPMPGRLQQDISTIVDLQPMHEARGDTDANRAWALRRTTTEQAETFVAAPAPFKSLDARQAVAAALRGLVTASAATLVALDQPRTGTASLAGARLFPSIAQRAVAGAGVLPAAAEGALANYIGGSPTRFLVSTRDRTLLVEASSSGAIVRWDPVAPLAATSPGTTVIDRPLPSVGEDNPIVGILDGGLSDATFDAAVAWREPPFVDAAELDTAHGNRVARLVVDAHTWNERLVLPGFNCRIGIVPVVPRAGYGGPWPLDGFLAYVDRVVRAHPDTRVWNLSANEPHACAPDRVSDFGHGLNELARRNGVLFVISTGNRLPGVAGIIAPPADNDAAITVGGRGHGADGVVGNRATSRAPAVARTRC